MTPSRPTLPAWAALIAALALPAAARSAPPGFAFLEVPAGARISALGGAGGSFATGTEAIFWNPAALDRTHGVQVVGSHFELFENLRHDDFALGGLMWGGGVAASVRALYTGTIDERDELGNLIGGFGAHDLEFALGYGRRLQRGLSVGGTAQLVREPGGLGGLRMALSAHNLGPAAHYTLEGDRGDPVALPAAVQAGASCGIPVGGLSLRGGLEGRFASGRNGIGIAAAELGGLAGASLRGGFRVNDSASEFSLGVGYALPGLQLDYAWVPSLLDLEDTHRVSFRAEF